MRPFAVASTFALALAGCSGHSDTTPPDDAGAPADDGPRITCQNDPRVDTYTAEMSKASAGHTFTATLVSSDPAPPALGNNTFQVTLAPPSGGPMPAGSLAVDLFMPDHGHGTSVVPSITTNADGSYTIAPLYFFMPGVWRVTLSWGEGDASAPDKVQFFFCVAG